MGAPGACVSTRAGWTRCLGVFALVGLAVVACSDGGGGGGDGDGEADAGPTVCVAQSDCSSAEVCINNVCVPDNPADAGQPDAGADTAGPGPGVDAGGGGQDIAPDTGGGTCDMPDFGTPEIADEFWLLYQRRNRNASAGAAENDVVLTRPSNPGALDNASTFGIGISPLDPSKPGIKLTEFAFSQAGGLNCNYGCVLSPDMRFIAVATGPAGPKGFEFALGSLSPSLELTIGKFGTITDVADLHFAGDFLFYSTPVNQRPTGTYQYGIRRRAMVEGAGGQTETEIELTRMAPDFDPDVINNDTVYTGRFQVSEDASTLVFLAPTIRSLRIYAWRDGNLNELDYICENPVGDTCVGDGSEYSDHDGLAVSRDGKTVVVFTVVGNVLRARRYEVGGQQTPSFTNLVELPVGTKYLQGYCDHIADWQHAEVIGSPQFSADGKWIYMLGYTKCGEATEKAWTDIMAVRTAKIGDGTPFTEADWVNITQNPRDNSAANMQIREFSVSPERTMFLLSATPRYGSDGKPLTDASKRAENDSELYAMPIAPCPTPLQITNEVSYDALSPFAAVP